MRYGVFSALGAVALLALTFALPARLTDADTPSGAAPAYEIEVLPGVAHSDPMNEKRWSIDAAGNATMTSGWHLNNNSIDLRGTSSSDYDDIVVAQFRVVTNPTVEEVIPGVGVVPVPRIYARVSAIHDTDDDSHELCRKVRVELYDHVIQEDGAAKPIGELTYTHIDPDNNLKEGDPVPLEDGAGALQLGAIILAATDRALGANCKNYGDHLHQQANSNVAGTALWRNYDRADRRADDGMGFDPPLWGSGYTTPYPKFCADIWIFKIYPPRPSGTASSEHGPRATPVEKCAAPDNAPSSLSVSEGDGTLNLSWAAPELVSAENEQVTGYQVRSRQTPDGAWESWESTATTSYTISDLANDTTYAVQVRAVNSAAEQTVKRSGGATRTLVGAGLPATVTGTPMLTPTATEPSAPTNLTAEGADGRIRLAWTDPEDSSISSYEYCTNTAAGADCTSWRTMTGATATTTRHTISLLANGSRLMNGTTYYVKIRARNAEGTSRESNEDSATPMATTTPPQPIASLTINAAAIAGDGTVNEAEKAAGFAISGSSEAGATVTVTVGTTALSAVTAGSTGSWTVSVPAAASYVSDGRLTISATATRSGFSDGSASVTATVDTVPPVVSYNNVPTSLTVNTEVTISPTTTDDDIHRYALKTGSTLPSDLSLDDMSGVISGSPDAATTAAVNLTIVVTDNARNSLDVPLRLPAVTAATTPPPTTYTLAATAGAGGSVSCATASGPASCSGTFEVGTGVTVTADPNDGYQVDSWSGDCSGSGSGPTCTVAMNAPRSAHVTFEAIPLPAVTMGRPTSAPASVTEGATIAFRVIRSGSTAASLPVTWSVTQSGDFISGTPQSAGTIRAGNRGGVFRVSTANDGVDERDGSVKATVTGGGGTYTIGAPSSATVTVTDNDETLTTSAGENGTISPRPGDHVYTHDTPVTVTATPNTNYEIASWGGDCSSTAKTSSTCELTMDANKSASVTFERATWDLDVTKSGCCGSVSVSPSGPYNQGDNTSVTLTATPSSSPAPGPVHSFDGWGGDCSGRSTTCTLTMNDDKSVTASFSNSCDGSTGFGCRRQEEDGGGAQPPPPAP